MKSESHYWVYFSLALLLLSYSTVYCQERFPVPGELYNDSNIARVDITISQESLDLILKDGNEYSDDEYMAIFKFNRAGYSETIDSVGFRLRGNTSRRSSKKSFKVSLNTFIPGQKFQGVEKINLNGEHNDPSISRAHISWYLFRSAGVPASRSNHVELYINDQYKGVYINVEHIDEEFVDQRFGKNVGNLYKCLWPADLNYIGSSPENYKLGSYSRRTYELKTNVMEDDYSDLAELIDIVNNTLPSNFPVELGRIMNINSYLKNLAVEVLIGHWDAYAYNKNNFYLYHNNGTDKFEFIPYDPDNTFGISWSGEDWNERNIYEWSNESEDRPLMENVLLNETYRDRYSFYLNRLIEEVFNSSHLNPILDDIRSKISGPAMDDLYRTYDYGYSYSDFYNSFDSETGAHVRLGIKPYISTRSSSAMNQLDVNPIEPIISLLYVNTPILSEAAKIEFLVEDDGSIDNVKLWFSSGSDFNEWILSDKGNGLYSSNHAGLTEDGVLRFYIEATDNEMNVSRDPVQGYYSIPYGNASISSRPSSISEYLVIYPNPACSFLNVEIAEGIVSSYIIIDITGRTVQEGELLDAKNVIYLDKQLPDGMYSIGMRSGVKSKFYPGMFKRFIIVR